MKAKRPKKRILTLVDLDLHAVMVREKKAAAFQKKWMRLVGGTYEVVFLEGSEWRKWAPSVYVLWAFSRLPLDLGGGGRRLLYLGRERRVAGSSGKKK